MDDNKQPGVSRSKVTVSNPSPKKGWKAKLKAIVLICLAVGLLGCLVASIWVYSAYKDLPQISTLDSYRPLLPLKMYAMDGTPIGEYGEQIREVVPIERIPERLKQAYIATEDSSFYDHFGVNPMAIVRAAIANFKAGRKVQGGSTITQQLAKTFWLTPERTYTRKLKEVFLAMRMERNMSKDEILWLYCNQIYLGHGAYGVAMAARNYFGKDLSQLTLAEIGYLGGLPKAPTTYSPYSNPKTAKKRQQWVLSRMFKEGYITAEQRDAAIAEEVKVYPTPDSHTRYAPYYAEQTRRDLLDRSTYCVKLFKGEKLPSQAPDPEVLMENMPPEKWGERFPGHRNLPSKAFCDALRPYYDDIMSGEEKFKIEADKSIEQALIYRCGLQVDTASNIVAEFRAQDAVLYGLRRITKRQGYNGPNGHLNKKDWPQFFKVYDKKYSDPKKLSRRRLYPAMIVEIDDKKRIAWVRIGKIKAPMHLSDVSWARVPKAEVRWEYEMVKKLSARFKPGDIIIVRPSDRKGIVKREDFRSRRALPEDPKDWHLDLIQKPYSQAALMIKDVDTGYVLSSVGGWNYEESQINRPVQACRQPGSSFKPLVYSTAVEKEWTPATIIVDSPVVNQDDTMRWTPQNYGNSFSGDTPLVKALSKSMNICAIKALQYAGVRDVTNLARRFGLTSFIAQDFSIALGSSCVYMDELTQAYMHFPRLGMPQRKVTIRVIRDAYGNILEDYRDPSDYWLLSGPETFARMQDHLEHPLKRHMSQKDAFIMLKLMEQVVQTGTGVAAKSLKRPLAGKTGTTNDSFDAWFMGYAPDLVVGAWVGFDQNERHLGRGETGGSVALPIWLDFMKNFLDGAEVKEFPEAPKSIQYVSIDYENGKLTGEATTHPVKMPFIWGTAPTEKSGESQDVDPDVFLQGGGGM